MILNIKEIKIDRVCGATVFNLLVFPNGSFMLPANITAKI
jgi:hypothetical protein